jgi:hypothetical protein
MKSEGSRLKHSKHSLQLLVGLFLLLFLSFFFQVQASNLLTLPGLGFTAKHVAALELATGTLRSLML